MPFPYFILPVILWIILVAGPSLDFRQIVPGEIGSFMWGIIVGFGFMAWIVSWVRNTHHKGA